MKEYLALVILFPDTILKQGMDEQGKSHSVQTVHWGKTSPQMRRRRSHLEKTTSELGAKIITVHATLNTVEFYRKCGFDPLKFVKTSFWRSLSSMAENDEETGYQDKWPAVASVILIGHFRVPICLFQSESKCENMVMKMTLICTKMKLRAELIFIRMVSHLDSVWNRGTRELGNGLFMSIFYLPRIYPGKIYYDYYNRIHNKAFQSDWFYVYLSHGCPITGSQFELFVIGFPCDPQCFVQFIQLRKSASYIFA